MTTPPMTVPEALRAVVETRADVVAIQDEDEDEERSLTFSELELTTNNVAAEFCERTILGAPIAVIAEHTAHAALSMLATTKAGRISVVLDPREPPNRLAQLYKLAGCELLVASDPVPGLDLQDRGERVALLALLDAREPGTRPERRERRRRSRARRTRSRLMRYVGTAPWRSLPDAWRAARRRAARIAKRFRRMPLSRVERTHQLARASRQGPGYLPRPYGGHTLVVESDATTMLRWHPTFTGTVEVLQLPGTHLEVLDADANVAALAARIDEVISGVGRGGEVGELDDLGLGPVGRS